MKAKLKKHIGFTLIEVVIAIVVMSIAILTLPVIMAQAQKSEAFYMHDDLFFKAVTLMYDAAGRSWDEAVFRHEVDGNATLVIPVEGGDDNLDCNSAVAQRVGHFVGEGRRKCYAEGNASNIPTGAKDLSTVEINATEQFNDGNLTATSTIYEENYIFSFTVRYAEDNVTRRGNREFAVWKLTGEGAEGNLKGDGMGATVNDRTNLKRIVLTAKRRSGSEEFEFPFVYFSSNIGATIWGNK
ncbi:MAG: prepilin-type N-terminal cleavage/methylation domain-containing protein [Campylobacterales bacterium]